MPTGDLYWKRHDNDGGGPTNGKDVLRRIT
jgi:hypothetical protein